MTNTNSINLKPLHVLINIGLVLLALLFALAAILAMIVLGAGTSALSLVAPNGSNLNIMLYTFGSSIPAVFIAVLTYYLFNKTSIKKTWLIFFFSLPILVFWLYMVYTNGIYEYHYWPNALNFLVFFIAFMSPFYAHKIKSKT